MPKHKPDVLSVDDAAAILGVSSRRVRALIETGKLPARRFDKKSWLILPRAVEHYKKHREEKNKDWPTVAKRGRAPTLPKGR